jgi:hypothetical protein
MTGMQRDVETILKTCQEDGDLQLAAKVLQAISPQLQHSKALVAQQVSLLAVGAIAHAMTPFHWSPPLLCAFRVVCDHPSAARDTLEVVPVCCQALISLLQSCKLVNDTATAAVLAKFHLQSFCAPVEEGSGSASGPAVAAVDPRAFQDQFMRFCAQAPRNDALAVDYLSRLVELDSDNPVYSQLFGQYIGMVATLEGAAAAADVVNSFATMAVFDGWPWVYAVRRLGVVLSPSRGHAEGRRLTGGGSSKAGPPVRPGQQAMVHLLQHVFDVACQVVQRVEPKSPESPMWDTLIDSYVMSLTRQVSCLSPVHWCCGRSCLPQLYGDCNAVSSPATLPPSPTRHLSLGFSLCV